MTPAAVFRDNLRRLTGAFDLDFDGLAVALGFGRDDKKWLSRAWLNGLAKYDNRSRGRLRLLATFFGLENARDMWVPEVEPDPAKLAESTDNRWNDFVARVANVMRVIDRVWSRYPNEMSSILRSRGVSDNNELIAQWTAAKYGACQLGEDEQTIISRIDEEFGHAIELERTTNAIVRLADRIAQHPAFPDMVVRMHRTLNLQPVEGEVFDHERGEYVEFPHELTWADDFWLHFKRRICEAMSRPLSSDEIYSRFAKRYLGEEDEEDDNPEMLRSIISELSAHPYWGLHVTGAFSGDFFAAEANVAAKWKEAQESSSHTITVHMFVHFYNSQILDELKIRYEYETEPGDTGGTRKRLAD